MSEDKNGHAQAQPPLRGAINNESFDEFVERLFGMCTRGKTRWIKEDLISFLQNNSAAARPAEQPAFRDFGPMSCCICGDPTINRKFLPSEEMIALHVCKTEQPSASPQPARQVADKNDARELDLEAVKEFWRKFPHCWGGARCDGDLVGEPHEPECPMFPDKKEMGYFEFAAAYAAAVTQERDALRPLLEFFVNSRNVIVPAIACHFGEETIKICGCNGCILQRRFKHAKAVLDTYPPRAAAEESQPK